MKEPDVEEKKFMEATKVKIIPNIDYESLAQELNSLVTHRVLMLLGSCTADFDGRIKSKLGKGDRILIIKQDETLLLHSPTGLKPINWQLAGAGKIAFKVIDNNFLQMYTYRPKTEEFFTITFEKVHLAMQYSAIDYASLNVYGDESDMIKYLVENPDVIENGLKVLEQEKETTVGFVDIFAEDAEERKVIVEVKKQAATPSDAHQLKRYRDYFEHSGEKYRGILVSAHTPDKVLQYLQQHNLESVSVPWQEIFPTIKRPRKLTLHKWLDNNKNSKESNSS